MHCHLLPGMDDGSDSVETTNQILCTLARQGVTQVAATPHFYGQKDDPESFLRRRGESLAALHWQGVPEIIPGAEVAYFEGMGRCEEMKDLTLGGTKLILVEMPFKPWTEHMVREVVMLSQILGLRPVIAHCERYRARNQLPKFLRELVEQGVVLQCNAEAFLDAKSCRWALNMVKKGYVGFLGTDAHNLTDRAPQYGQAAQLIGKKLGQDVLREITGTI